MSDAQPSYRTFLVAVVAHSDEDVQKFLLASPLGPNAEEGVIDSWWVAEDDRTDRSDNDSAIFVPRGSQSDLASVRDQWFDYHQQEWDEEGYPYAGTDVSGTWYVPADVRRAL
jgi:hypothetical protein